MTESTEALDYFAAPGVMTDLGRHADRLVDTPRTPTEIAAMVQGLLVHPHWAVAYDVIVGPEHQAELQIRSAAAMIDAIVEIDDRPLSDAREPGYRLLGNCRDFSTLTTALLRRTGTPARARCGFAGYFETDRWVDHWIVEHWNGERWQVLDPQIDDLQREVVQLEPEPSDLPPDYFLTAPAAWIRCQRGELDGDQFGILDMWGQWFVRSNVGRDIAALNKVEMLPWDDWGALAGGEEATASDAAVDELSALVQSNDTAAIRARYAADPALQVTATVMSLVADGEWGPDEVIELR